MFSIEIECPPEQNELLIAELWADGSAGIVELEGGGLRAFFEDAARSWNTAWGGSRSLKSSIANGLTRDQPARFGSTQPIVPSFLR